MFVLDGNIKIGKFTFRSVHNVEITKSVDELSDTAIIKLPTRFKVKESGKELFSEEALKIGDAVSITLGYLGEYSGVEFSGFVRKIKPTTPLTIECEDAIWQLRRKNITKAWNNGTTLKEVLLEVVKGTAVQLADTIAKVPLDKYIIKNANGAQVLQAIKKNMAMSIFLNDEGKLYCGLQQADNIGKVAIYDLNYNIVKNDLEYKTADERRIKVKYTYKGKDGSDKSIEVGDADGEQRTFTTSVISDEVKLKELATAEMVRLKYDGYDGSLTSFLLPYATRGMTAELRDSEHKNRAGKYFIKKVVTSFGTGGGRRKVTIGAKL